jgi:NitT/TauT family transport system substrate-binding protein
MTMTGFYIATEEGYTREEGLDAEMVQMVGTLSAQSMIARQIDFGMSAGALLAARLRGAPTRVIFVQIDKPLYYLYAQPEIGTVLDLVGKSVGVSSVGDSTQVAAMVGLAAGGVRPDQVTFIANVTGSQALAALQAGSVAAAVTSPPTDVATERLGYRSLGFLGDHLAYLTAGLATHEEILRDRPAVVRGIVRAELKAHRYMQQNRAGTIAHMARFQEVPLEEAAIVYDRNLQHWTTDGLSTPERLEEMVRTLRQELGVDEPVSPDDAFALGFAHQAVEELDRAGWRP